MDNKLQRLGRACKNSSEATGSLLNEAPNDPLEAFSPKLWRDLPVGLAYKVLSFLPVDRLVNMLRHVIGRKFWQRQNFLTSPGFSQIFSHGNNLASTYGFVTLPNRNALWLAAFEDESMQWREFPKKLPAEVKQCRLISGSDGLLVCESRKCRITNLSYYTLLDHHEETAVHYPDIGVWNPLLQSFKWLPIYPQLAGQLAGKLAGRLRSLPYFDCVQVMVDELSKTYKVFLLDRKFYSVYNSGTRVWNRSKLVPSFASVGRRSAACGRYIFFNNVFEHDSLCRYDVQRDSWDRFFVSKIFTDLDCTPGDNGRAWTDSFAILGGILYVLIRGTSEGIVMASMELSIAETSPWFKLVTVVPISHLPSGGGMSYGFNLYAYTLKRKVFVGVRTSTSGHFLHFDVSRGDWLASDKFPDLARVKECFALKPSFVVP